MWVVTACIFFIPREVSRDKRGSQVLRAYLAQRGPRVLQAQWSRAPLHNPEHKDPRDLRGHQGRMALQEGMANR